MSLFDAGRDAAEITLVDLLKIEDTAELLAPRCPRTSIPVWPIVRIAFLRQIMADLLFGGGSTDPPAQLRSWRATGVLSRAVLHNLASRLGRNMRSDVLINTDMIGDERRDGSWFNKYADPFGDLSTGQAVVMADMFDWQWHTPRHNERIVYHAPVQVSAALMGRLPHTASTRLAEAVTALACERARALVGWDMGDARRTAFARWAAHKIAGLPLRYNAYRRLLRRVQPRLLLGLAGCYGAHAPLIAAARDLDIVTAEFQHGAISVGHDAYNFAPAIDSEAYRRTLPQYLLTYGAWWSAQVSAPVECVTIGNPARARKLAQFVPPCGERRTVLILGDGIEFDLYLDLARTIATAVAGAGLDVALRPHPLERRNVSERYGSRIDDVRIDIAPDIYSSFATAHTVVSEVSTGLFEAVGLVDRIVLLNTAKARFAYPEHPFAAASSAQEVIDLVRNGDPPMLQIGKADLWADDWQSKYERFLAEKVGIDV